MAQSDPNRILRLLPLVIGGLGGTLLLINRLMTPELTNSQSRADALGVILSALLILTGMLWQRVQPRMPESVELVGPQGFELDATLPEAVKLELAWASHSLLTNTVTKSMVVWYNGKILLRRGVLGTAAELTPGPIVKRVLESEKPIYLVALKLYPGRVEFPYLPENTQGVICQPLGTQGVLVLGANAPRSYTQQDEAWVAAIADKLSATLAQMPSLSG
jgi:Cofactor assembly of complex C subunit B, CCB2/CCB4